MHKTARAQGFFAKIDQEADPVVALVQIEQALLDIFRPDGGGRFGFQDQFVVFVSNDEIYAAFSDDVALIYERYLDLALKLQSLLG